jgi:hypothetical protein
MKYLEGSWGKALIEYKGPNQAAYTNLAGTLYVLKGTEVTFREVASGSVQKHTFSVNSASNGPSGEITANLTFGTNTHAVKAIVFEIKTKVTFKDNFPNRSQKDLGVNEHIDLGFDSDPAGITAAQAGKLLWTIHGTATSARQFQGQLQRSSADATAPQTDGTAYFIAPWATDESWPTGPRPSQRSRVTTLRLVIQGGPSQGLYVEKSFTVHTPVARMVAGQSKHAPGKPSAGFTGNIYFDPKNVSFHFIDFKEGRGTMVAKQTGFKRPPDMRMGQPPRQLPASPSGYFAWEGPRIHQHTSAWVSIGTGNIVTGCKLDGPDDVYSGFNDQWPYPYNDTHGALLKGKETDVPSEVSWPINWNYKAKDLSTAVVFQKAMHKATMDANGTVTMEKAQASYSAGLP